MVRDVETIIALGYSHSIPFSKGHTTNSATVILTPGDGTTDIMPSGVICITYLLIFQNLKIASKCTGGTMTGSKHFLAALPTQR